MYSVYDNILYIIYYIYILYYVYIYIILCTYVYLDVGIRLFNLRQDLFLHVSCFTQKAVATAVWRWASEALGWERVEGRKGHPGHNQQNRCFAEPGEPLPRNQHRVDCLDISYRPWFKRRLLHHVITLSEDYCHLMSPARSKSNAFSHFGPSKSIMFGCQQFCQAARSLRTWMLQSAMLQWSEIPLCHLCLKMEYTPKMVV